MKSGPSQRPRKEKRAQGLTGRRAVRNGSRYVSVVRQPPIAASLAGGRKVFRAVWFFEGGWLRIWLFLGDTRGEARRSRVSSSGVTSRVQVVGRDVAGLALRALAGPSATASQRIGWIGGRTTRELAEWEEFADYAGSAEGRWPGPPLLGRRCCLTRIGRGAKIDSFAQPGMHIPRGNRNHHARHRDCRNSMGRRRKGSDGRPVGRRGGCRGPISGGGLMPVTRSSMILASSSSTFCRRACCRRTRSISSVPGWLSILNVLLTS